MGVLLWESTRTNCVKMCTGPGDLEILLLRNVFEEMYGVKVAVMAAAGPCVLWVILVCPGVTFC